VGKLDNKTAIVTGAASGIGYASAVALAREGARLVIADINGDGAEGVAAELTANGAETLALRVDLAQPDSIEEMINKTIHRFDGIDILFNNAANTAVVPRDLDLVQMDLEVWEQTMAVNLRGVMLGCKFALPHMLAAGSGTIINTSSASSLAGDLGLTAYGVSKAGVNALTQYIATQYGKQGIRCNAIAPGVINTPALQEKTSPQQRAGYASHHLTANIGEPTHIANTVVFLASDESAFITGQIISVDGGLMSHHPTVAQFRPTD